MQHYLQHFPYPCTEQLISKAFAALLLAGNSEFHISRAVALKHLQQALQMMRARQTTAGGFSLWPGDSRTDKFASIYAMDFLTTAKQLGYPVPNRVFAQGMKYLQQVARIYAQDQQLLRLTLNQDEKYRLYTPLADISPILLQTLLFKEDKYFYYHFGVNPIALVKGAWRSFAVADRRVGASTITMQLARIRYGINSKTLTGKLKQIIKALKIELHYSKVEILEAYLNLAPFGSNIEGVGAASFIYFGKSAQDLSLPEALLLSVMPQNPNKYRVTTELQQARLELYKQWLNKYPASRSYQVLVNLPLNLGSRNELPFRAPHFVTTVLQKQPQKNKLITTLNPELQKIIRRQVDLFVTHQRQFGIENVAVLLVDTRTMGIKALLGSSDFSKESIHGQVNGVLAKRSPGSTLKPFIYALALEQGLIHPLTILKDTPQSFGKYNPENFDSEFMGPITAQDALTLSRNVPAVYLAERLSGMRLYDFLQQAGIEGLQAENNYGLSLALGSAELSLYELVKLYAVFANGGLLKPLHWLKNTQQQKGKRLLSPEASYLILQMLQTNPRPSTFSQVNWQKKSLSVAWKTGTSSGYRDAWSIGIFTHYVLGVWVGEFSGKGKPSFTGRDAAAPLMFQIIQAIEKEQGPFKDSQGATQGLNLKKVSVCSLSGGLETHSAGLFARV